jgi:transaldolase
MSDRLQKLADAGVSIWLDDLSRERLNTGNLAQLVAEKSVTGVTTNPTIFATALAKGQAYDDQMQELAASGADVDDAIRALTTDDVRNACDVMSETYQATDGKDGRVSIEVSPLLAMETDATIAEAADLWKTVDRPNTLIKIPATEPGLPAITKTLSEGISVNVTLIFALERYQGVMDAYMAGLEQAAANGHDLSTIHSVASFFVSRVDSEVDKRLDAIGTDEARQLKGKAAIANARLAYALYERVFSSDRWAALEAKGANRQRPLWASTGVKDPAYSDTMYVSELVVANTVNTMPEKTMDAFADHGEVTGDTVTGREEEAQQTLDALAGLGIEYDDVVAVLETEGVDKFEKSWHELVETVRAALEGDDKEAAQQQASHKG